MRNGNYGKEYCNLKKMLTSYYTTNWKQEVDLDGLEEHIQDMYVENRLSTEEYLELIYFIQGLPEMQATQYEQAMAG